MILIQELYKEGKISEQKRKELDIEVEKSGKTEEEVILDNKIVVEEDLFKLKSNIVKIPLLKPNPEEISLDVLELVSEEAAINYKMTPLFKKDNVVGV
ncbi:MAG: hypothetical protein AABY22_17015, partial [Nanoarchaeota archaeon]